MPMGHLTLLLAIHNHQPDGNFGHVFQQAYDDCYRPAARGAGRVRRTSRWRCTTPAPLLEWIERERPDYFDKLRALVERGQVELLGGGFYEPMLAVLPERDARGQIRDDVRLSARSTSACGPRACGWPSGCGSRRWPS